ncbi:MAG: beta-propeller domain-containing protein [Myxococcota bacterium]|nr:beta-propeller domain-containing protein [Myxococcota bacterium]
MKLSHAPQTLRMAAVATMAASIMFQGAACDQQTTNEPNFVQGSTESDRLDWTATAALGASSSCEHALDQLKDNVRTEMLIQAEHVRRQFVDPDSFWGGWGMTEDVNVSADGAMNAAPSSEGGSGAPPQDVSETNVQVQGVDEADFVKTDAEFLYTLAGDDMVIVAAWPADDMVEVGRVAVKGNPHSLYRYGTDIVVLSYGWRSLFTPPAQEQDKGQGEDEASYYDWHSWQPMTVVTVIDASNPASPRVTRTEAFEGNLSSTRRIGADVYLVQNTWSYIQGLQYWPNVRWDAPLDERLTALNRMVVENLNLIDTLTLHDFLPYRYSLTHDGMLDAGSEAFAADCQHIYLPSAHSGTNLTTVVTLNLDNGTTHGSAVPGNWGSVYASVDALYVSATNWGYYWYWNVEDEAPSVTSHIHKFDISPQSGRANYVASGSVPGYVLNQFSMDEYEGNLRVATTEPNWWGWWGNDDTSESHVTVLGQSGGQLKPLGHVGGLGKGEQIYSVRFIRGRGYVVTFRQVDPLYVLDLRNPRDVRVTGELKIPGFSSYMHPMDETHLLTVGRDATEEGQVQGLQFQIFDVDDPSSPELIQKTVLGDGWNTWSEALWDHHAFNYFAARGLLGLPVSGWEYNEDNEDGWGWYGRYVSKLQLFKVDIQDGITPVGAISHDTLFDAYEGDQDCMQYYSWGWESQIRRSVFMDDFVYTLSSLGVRVHDTRDLEAGSITDVLTLDEDANPYKHYGCY